MRKVRFHKYQALENDFLVIAVDAIPESLKMDFVCNICARHIGIGADGVIFFDNDKDNFRMRVFNADGSEAEISGNGLRIMAQYIYQHEAMTKKSFIIRSVKGENRVKIISGVRKQVVSRISLGVAKFALSDIPMRGLTEYFINLPFATASGELLGTAVSIGNPHMVFFVDNFDFDWQTFGGEVEADTRFPMRTNVEFAIINSRKRLTHCSWERGVGVTRASGTGASSAVAAGIINGYLDHRVTVCEPAGELDIELRSLDDEILLTGPSVQVGEGVFIYDSNEKINR